MQYPDDDEIELSGAHVKLPVSGARGQKPQVGLARVEPSLSL